MYCVPLSLSICLLCLAPSIPPCLLFWASQVQRTRSTYCGTRKVTLQTEPRLCSTTPPACTPKPELATCLLLRSLASLGRWAPAPAEVPSLGACAQHHSSAAGPFSVRMPPPTEVGLPTCFLSPALVPCWECSREASCSVKVMQKDILCRMNFCPLLHLQRHLLRFDLLKAWGQCLKMSCSSDPNLPTSLQLFLDIGCCGPSTLVSGLVGPLATSHRGGGHRPALLEAPQCLPCIQSLCTIKWLFFFSTVFSV